MTLALLALVTLLPAVGTASNGPAAPAVTPAQALDRLKEGNARFVEDVSADLKVDAERRAELVAGQAPYALVLSCADSRVPPEIVFNTGLGELFVVRAAGQVLDRSVLASLEYGAEHLKAPLLVVMGHEFCGAVKAARERKPGASMGPNLDFLLKQIQPAIAYADKALFEEPLRAAILANVAQEVSDLQLQSPILRTAVERGKLQIVGAFYELTTGKVVFSHTIAGKTAAPALTRREPTATGTPAPAPHIVTARTPAAHDPH